MATHEIATHEQTPIVNRLPFYNITEALNPRYALTDYHIPAVDICALHYFTPTHIIPSFSFYLNLFFCVASVFFYASHPPQTTLAGLLVISDLCTLTAWRAGMVALHPVQMP